MANAFDQFDEPAPAAPQGAPTGGNPFDQFDAAPPSAYDKYKAESEASGGPDVMASAINSAVSRIHEGLTGPTEEWYTPHKPQFIPEGGKYVPDVVGGAISAMPRNIGNIVGGGLGLAGAPLTPPANVAAGAASKAAGAVGLDVPPQDFLSASQYAMPGRRVAPKGRVPTQEELYAGRFAKPGEDPASLRKGEASYDPLRNTPAPSDRVNQAIEDIRGKLDARTLDPEIAPAVHKRLDHLERRVADNEELRVGHLDNYKKLLDDIHPTAGSEYRAAQIASKELGDLIKEVEPGWSEADANYAAGHRTKTMHELLTRSENQMASNQTNATSDVPRKMAKQWLNNEGKQRGFSQEVIDQIDRVNKGTITGNTAKAVGDQIRRHAWPAAVTSAVLSAVLSGGNIPLALSAALGTATASEVLRSIARRSNMRQLEKAHEMTRMESPLYLKNRPQPTVPIARLASPFGAAAQSPFNQQEQQ